METVHTSFFSVYTGIFTWLFFGVEQGAKNVHKYEWQSVVVPFHLSGKKKR
jgi:hypothetical protein